MKIPIQYRIEIDGTTWDFDRRILDARRIGDRVIIIFDYMSFPKSQQAQNFMAYDLNRKLLWVAEHPTTQNTDTYINITSEEPLKASNFASFSCEIEIETGKLRNAVFTK